MLFAANIQRSFFKKDLLEKLSYWLNDQSKKDLYPNLELKPSLGILRVNSGFYYLSDSLIYFSNIPEGSITRIKKIKNLTQINLYSDLYKVSIENKKFHMDALIYSEIITDHKGNQWEYAELRSPKNQYGINVVNHYFSPSLNGFFSSLSEENWHAPEVIDLEQIRNATIIFAETYTAQFYEIVKAASEIADRKNQGLIPLRLGSLPTFYQDDEGFFWSDFDHDEWDSPIDAVVDRGLLTYSVVLGFIEKINRIDKTTKDRLIETARNKWKTI